MKTTVRTIALIAAVVALSACSSFKLGAGCYIPHGTTGQCSAATIEGGSSIPQATPKPAAQLLQKY